MIIVIIAVVVLVVGGGAILFLGFGDDDSDKKPAIAEPTWPGVSSPPSFSAPPFPSSTPYSPPDDYSPPPTYSPPPQHWGAIAVAHDGSVGKAWDYDTAEAAKRRALNECPRTGCKVLTSFVNGCGAIAYNPHTNRYWGGHGDTRTEAERAAISNAGGGHWTTWVCTTR